LQHRNQLKPVKITMKICFFSYEYPDETDFGEIGRSIYYAARGMRDLGHEVWVVAGAVKNKHELREEDGIRVMRSKINGDDSYLNMIRKKLSSRQLYRFQSRLESAYTIYRSYEELRLTNDFDVIEMPERGCEGFFIGRHASDVRKIMRLHSPLFMTAPYCSINEDDLSFSEKIENAPMRYADAVTAPSIYVAAHAQRRLGLDKEIYVAPNGVDVDEIDRVPKINVREKFGVPADAKIVFFTGRLERRNGTHLLADIVPAVLKQHPEAFFVVAGRNYKDLDFDIEYELARRGVQDRIILPGKIDHHTTVNFMRDCEIFIYTSLWSNSPVSVLEAMACRAPIVSFESGGVVEMVENGVNGLLVKNNQSDLFADGLNELLGDSLRAAEMGQRGREDVMDYFDNKTTAKRMLKIYSFRGAKVMHKGR
jgi:1,4-alpha-glucan branching enzyme